MGYWLLYDIEENRDRNKIAQICLDAGFKRFQNSCYFGEISHRSAAAVMDKIAGIVHTSDKVCLIPFETNRLDEIKTLGEFKLQNEEKVLFV